MRPYACCEVPPIVEPGGTMGWIVRCGNPLCCAWTSDTTREAAVRMWSVHRAHDDDADEDPSLQEDRRESGYQGSDTIESRVAAQRLK